MTLNLTKNQLSALMADLNPKRIKSRTQSGRSLSYLESYDVKATLIRVFGCGGFSADVVDTQILKIETDIPKRGGGTTAFRVTAMSTVRLTIHGNDVVDGEVIRSIGHDVTYTETAVASQAGADPGEVADFAVKTAESDALKRCATYLGTQFGLSLYADGQTQDVVRVVLEPEQKAMMDAVREESQKQHEGSVAELSERLARATTSAEPAQEGDARE